MLVKAGALVKPGLLLNVFALLKLLLLKPPGLVLKKVARLLLPPPAKVPLPLFPGLRLRRATGVTGAGAWWTLIRPAKKLEAAMIAQSAM